MTVSMIPAGEAQLCVETFGRREDPALLLIGGATSSMDYWESDLCRRLAEAGRYVVRYDHRDTGQSTSSPVGEPGYTIDDLSDDVLRVLDGLGVGRAHLVGLSMGGGLAQGLAVSHPERVLSLTLVATTCAFERVGTAPLPPPEARVADTFSQSTPDVDWSDEEAVVQGNVDALRPFAGSLWDEDAVRAVSRVVVRRTRDMAASVSNHWVVIGGDGEPDPHTMGEIDVPTLVLHGTEDPLLPLPHGEALAAEIRGATLLRLEGMGHEVPPRQLWDTVVPALVEHTAR
ncbi:MAG: alpha/beta hydrolase [Marmoricola sp.]|jgi:pimeloyl-ACP methyl ester carboxylesterase|nr:alpha/beta hydrolase [Marmoricola sp.]